MSIENVKYIKVYPGIGTARVGNSETYFIGPEAPGMVPNPGDGLLSDKSYKDTGGLIKPQAARFRVYGYDDNDNVVMEITEDTTNGINLQWDVHVRNLKAANYAFQGKFVFKSTDLRNPGVQAGLDPNDRTNLIIDPGQKTISGINKNNSNAVALDGGSIFSNIGQADIPTSLINPGETGDTTVTYKEKNVSLGRLETDDAGRLIFVGGKGDAGCLIDPPINIRKGVHEFDDQSLNTDPTSNGNSYFNNPGWYDDTCGGSINATVSFNTSNGVQTLSTNNEPTKRGWIAVSPPKYVPSMNNVVSLLDLQLDMFPEQDPVSGSLNFALIDAQGIPNIANNTEGSLLDFSVISGVTETATSAPSIASFNGQYYYAFNSNGSIYIASSSDGTTWNSYTIGVMITTSLAPSICVVNGNLTVAVVDNNGYVHLGRSADGTTFSFSNVTTPAGGVQAPVTHIAPSINAYNGLLYIGVTLSDGSLNLAVQDKKNQNLFQFYPISAAPQKSLGSVSMCSFFGQLYLAFTGTDNNSYLGTYNNLTQPADAPVFDFSTIALSQTTSLPPAITNSHGKLYYTVIGSGGTLFVGAAKPGFTSLTFTERSSITSAYAPAIVNFNEITFFRDIYPILRTVTDYAWVNEPAFVGHAPGSTGDFLRGPALLGYSNPNFTNNTYRRTVFSAIRPAEQLTPNVPPPPMDFNPSDIPEAIIQSGRLMPHLYGEGGSNTENNFNGTKHPNQWLSLTPHQLWKFQEWVNGNFTAGQEVVPVSLDSIPVTEQPKALDFSALEPTVGGGFHPGIELTYNMKLPGYFAAPFRFADEITFNGQNVGAITPGSVAGYMSIPWQGDFWSCNISWWAAMRPDIVVLRGKQDPSYLTAIPWFRGKGVGIPKNSDSIDGYEGGYDTMARFWSDFGFVVPDEGATKDQGMLIMQESERNPCLDDTSSPCTPVNLEAPQPNVRLGYAQDATPSVGNYPFTFYNNTITFPVPATGSITLAGNIGGTGSFYVDDKCQIFIEGNQLYTHDFSNGNSGVITPLNAMDITNWFTNYRGQVITMKINYIDLHPGSKGGSDFWICFS